MCSRSRTMRRSTATRAVFLVNITDPCWIWRGADLTQVASICARRSARSRSISRSARTRRRSRCRSRRRATASSRSASTSARAADRDRCRSTPAVSNHELTVLPPLALDKIEGTTRSVLPVHAREGRSDLGHRQARARRKLIRTCDILSPLAGWCAPLAEDARRGVRAGACSARAWRSIRPTHELRAPCDGEVISIAAARHAVALRTRAGAEILIHVGIDTVALGGEGFDVRVRKGDRVRAGDLLLTFDLELRVAPGAEPHDAGHRHERRTFPDPQREPESRARGRRCAVRARRNRGRGRRRRRAAARPWSAKRSSSRTRTASTRAPRR